MHYILNEKEKEINKKEAMTAPKAWRRFFIEMWESPRGGAVSAESRLHLAGRLTRQAIRGELGAVTKAQKDQKDRCSQMAEL